MSSDFIYGKKPVELPPECINGLKSISFDGLAYFSADGKVARCFMYADFDDFIEEHSRARTDGYHPFSFSQTFYLRPDHPLYNHPAARPVCVRSHKITTLNK